jgi:outer membrane protein W
MTGKYACVLWLRTRSIAAIGLLVSAVLATPTVRAQDGYDFRLFVGGAYVEPTGDTQVLADTIEASNEFGIELAGEWRFSRLGLEVAYLDVEEDVEVNGTAVGNIDLKPWNFTLNFHVIDGDVFNWFIGPTVSYVDWSSLRFPNGANQDIDNETTWGFSTGILFGLGDTFGIEVGLRYLDSTLESDNSTIDVSVDPLFARVGVSFRF